MPEAGELRSGYGGTSFTPRESYVADTLPPLAAPLHVLDHKKLEVGLVGMLSGRCVGFAMQMRRNGRILFDRCDGYALAPADGPQGIGIAWTTDTPMHIASMGKLFTAAATIRALDFHGIGIDEKIHGWLPQDWDLGPNVDRISFRHLLTHRSGLNYAGGPCDTAAITPCRIDFMRNQIAAGTHDFGKAAYRNVNYSLLRLLLYRIERRHSITAPDGSSGTDPHVVLGADSLMTDADLDEASIAAYENYLHTHLFDPAGAGSASMLPRDGAAWSYAAYNSTTGLAPVGWRPDAGSDGWFMSVREVLRALAAFRRGSPELPAARAREMLTTRLGIDQYQPTPMGPVYAKGGYWDDGGVQFTNAFLIPYGMELVIFVNSRSRGDLDVQNQTIAEIRAAMRPVRIVGAISALAGVFRGFGG